MPEPNDGINKLRVHRQMLHWHQPDFTGTWNENNQKQDGTFCNLRLVTIQWIVRITWEDKSICRLSINDISTEYTPTIHHTGSLKSQNSWSKRPKFGAASSTKIGEGNLLGLSREEWSAIHCCTVLVGCPTILAEVTQPCNTCMWIVDQLLTAQNNMVQRPGRGWSVSPGASGHTKKAPPCQASGQTWEVDQGFEGGGQLQTTGGWAHWWKVCLRSTSWTICVF